MKDRIFLFFWRSCEGKSQPMRFLSRAQCGQAHAMMGWLIVVCFVSIAFYYSIACFSPTLFLDNSHHKNSNSFENRFANMFANTFANMFANTFTNSFANMFVNILTIAFLHTSYVMAVQGTNTSFFMIR